MQRFILSLSLVVFCLSIPYDAGSTGTDSRENRKHRPRFYPFAAGESVQYEAGWNGIPVASANIEARPVWLDGEKSYQVTIKAKTWKAVDLIWKMRDSIEAVFDAKTFVPRRYIFYQKENRVRSETHAFYDQQSQKWHVRSRKGKKIKERQFVGPNTFDPVSASYLLRSLEVDVGDRFEVNLFGGHHRYGLTLHVVGHEKVELNAGVFNAYRIDAELFKQFPEGGDGKDREVEGRRGTLWISSDPQRLLLRATSRLWIGSVYLELVGDPGRTGSG